MDEYDFMNVCDPLSGQKNPDCENCEEFTNEAPCVRGEYLIEKRKEFEKQQSASRAADRLRNLKLYERE